MTESDQNGDLEVIVVGAGLAGLSAAIYLGRALRNVLVIDAGKSLAKYEPEVQNYLGFPDGISGEALLRAGRLQAEVYGVRICEDTIFSAEHAAGRFRLQGHAGSYACDRLLLATGLFHLPPEMPEVDACVGRSVFFCKDCDAYRVRGKRIAVLGVNNEAVEYALAMFVYTACVVVATNGRAAEWDDQHAAWLREYDIPIYTQPIAAVDHTDGQMRSMRFADGEYVRLDSAFTTRGDIYHNSLARQLGARTNGNGEILVDECMATHIPGLYAAGCVTPANCQMIIAAGQGAAAAQAINRSLFEQSLRTHALRRLRGRQLQTERTEPEPIT